MGPAWQAEGRETPRRSFWDPSWDVSQEGFAHLPRSDGLLFYLIMGQLGASGGVFAPSTGKFSARERVWRRARGRLTPPEQSASVKLTIRRASTGTTLLVTPVIMMLLRGRSVPVLCRHVNCPFSVFVQLLLPVKVPGGPRWLTSGVTSSQVVSSCCCL
jgi:hypothetical protein